MRNASSTPTNNNNTDVTNGITRSMYVIMYIAQRPDSIRVCGEINRVTAVADGLLLLICAAVRNENLDIAEHSRQSGHRANAPQFPLFISEYRSADVCL